MHHAIGKIEYFLSLTEPASLTLDVACGIGQSTVGLKRTAERIVGADPSVLSLIHEALLVVPIEADVPGFIGNSSSVVRVSTVATLAGFSSRTAERRE